MASPPLHGLLETMDTAFRKSGLLGWTSNTLLPVVTKTVENASTFVPQSHVSLYAEGGLNSWQNSGPQRT